MAEKYIFRKIKQSNMFPQLPQVMLRLIKACNSGKTSIEELKEIISADPSLTSRILQILGSSYLNLPKAVNSIETAVDYLGKDTIQNIAISTSAMRFFNFSEGAPESIIGKVWYHSYKCGVIARKMAEENNFPNPDEFFLAGLLHDIGRLVLLQNFPEDYKAILQTSSNEKQTISAEMEMFGADTPQISAWLFSQWNLNPLISDAVFFINESIQQIEGALSHVKIVFISNFLARHDALEKIPDIISLADISPSRLEQIVIAAEKEVLEMATNLDIKLGEAQDTFYEDALTSEIKNLSLFYGTLQNLMHAKDIETALDIAHNGFKIVFNIPRVFYFLLDEKKNILTGFCSPDDKSHKIIKSIALPLSNQSSLLIKCLKELKVQNSLKTTTDEELAISDTQIIRLLKAKGLYCIPIYSSEKAFGVMVLGVDETTAKNLEDNKGLVKLFSKQTGVCIQGIRFYKDYAIDIHEKKMEAYSTLTDKVIHEINNPISIIKNYIETLGLKLPDKHPAQEELVFIGEEMNRVAGLLDQLRSFSRPKIDGFELVDINKVCQSILELLKKSILLPRQIEASINIDPEIPKVKTDLNGLKQVLINLVKNSAEAMDKGGKITVTTRFLPDSPKILIDEKKQIPGNVELIISDNGPGIDEKLKETLFEPYATTKTGPSNSGLGLSIVHSIVKELNGKIRCESQQGKGTSFIITLPVISSKRKQI
ncbi:MAG: HDOD domain-containing protein [Deltaproteobacteria bacterium]|uniref:HDOD domain-containing protein n=1 Tax=Desulfobacula sp. TaxID=2593537 RepID=UPI0019AF2133|nr:HDOD domain-containing protein [Candidatus Desulfobacula maris]MBL6993079.1 HDOD domain-containing protein [Desulfobacula sp.]